MKPPVAFEADLGESGVTTFNRKSNQIELTSTSTSNFVHRETSFVSRTWLRSWRRIGELFDRVVWPVLDASLSTTRLYYVSVGRHKGYTYVYLRIQRVAISGNWQAFRGIDDGADVVWCREWWEWLFLDEWNDCCEGGRRPPTTGPRLMPPAPLLLLPALWKPTNNFTNNSDLANATFVDLKRRKVKLELRRRVRVN